MAGDVKVNSLELLGQYQGHLRKFSDCVEAGIILYRDQLRDKKEEILRQKSDLEHEFSSTIDIIDSRISQLENLQDRYDFSAEDNDRIEIEINKYSSQRASFTALIETTKEKLERQISILDDLWNLTYSFGNKTREMADSANGSLSSIIGTISNYKGK